LLINSTERLSSKSKEVRDGKEGTAELMYRFFCHDDVVALSVCLVGPAQSAPVPADTVVIGMSSLHEETFLPWNGGGPRKYYLDPIYEY